MKGGANMNKAELFMEVRTSLMKEMDRSRLYEAGELCKKIANLPERM